MLSMTSIVRAWKEDEYGQSRSEAGQAALPQNPAGMVELTDGELAEVAGGKKKRKKRKKSRSRSRS
mgnify:FL=1